MGAVEELVRNAVDADAEHVVVTLERNDLGGVDRVRVQDDGSGMSAEHGEEYFRPSAPPGRNVRSEARSRSALCTGRADTVPTPTPYATP
ncbi:ATP-binding protein [Streptomyces sp. NPDC050287]|uniref:ATP-binding protein n=1 Tax=Streptomyces sp. NPDC050287 TaxID=3365608 RepID=UPI0037A2AB4A